jgi:trans-2,3-dihydro-3-hydroxyanthranilate isomerase
VSDTLDYAVVDVFTDRAFAGNPLAVVLDADRLNTKQMQSVAREFNLSETTFVLPSTTDDATYRARIFTPTAELPFAGHPSVGTAWLLVHRERHKASMLVQECGAGLVQIVVDEHGAMLTGAAPTQSDVVDEVPYLQAVGLRAEDLDVTPSRLCGCGPDWGFLRVDDDALSRIAVDRTVLTALPGAGVCVFSYRDGRAHARVFAGGLGFHEDPATGSAALGLGVFLVASGLLPADGDSSYEIAQGGRDRATLAHRRSGHCGGWTRADGSDRGRCGRSRGRSHSRSSILISAQKQAPSRVRRSAHHDVHLDRRAQRQCGDADRGAGRVGLGEVLAVRLAHHPEIGDVCQVDADAEHVCERLSGGFQSRRDVVQDLVSLANDVAVDQQAGGRVLGHLPAEEQQPRAAYTDRERADRRREPVRGHRIACHRQ